MKRSLLPLLLMLASANRSMANSSTIQIAKDVGTKVFAAPPEITSEATPKFRDFVFYISSFTRGTDGRAQIHASGLYHGKPAGFELLLGKKWQVHPATKEVPEIRVRSGSVVVQADGTESNVFLVALATAYGFKAESSSMASHVDWAAMSFAGDPTNLAAGPVKSKLFFDSGDGKLYGEIYLNLDLKKRRIELAEKDSDYRKALVSIFSAPVKVNGIDVENAPVEQQSVSKKQLQRAGIVQ